MVNFIKLLFYIFSKSECFVHEELLKEYTKPSDSFQSQISLLDQLLVKIIPVLMKRDSFSRKKQYNHNSSGNIQYQSDHTDNTTLKHKCGMLKNKLNNKPKSGLQGVWGVPGRKR